MHYAWGMTTIFLLDGPLLLLYIHVLFCFFECCLDKTLRCVVALFSHSNPTPAPWRHWFILSGPAKNDANPEPLFLAEGQFFVETGTTGSELGTGPELALKLP